MSVVYCLRLVMLCKTGIVSQFPMQACVYIGAALDSGRFLFLLTYYRSLSSNADLLGELWTLQ